MIARRRSTGSLRSMAMGLVMKPTFWLKVVAFLIFVYCDYLVIGIFINQPMYGHAAGDVFDKLQLEELTCGLVEIPSFVGQLEPNNRVLKMIERYFRLSDWNVYWQAPPSTGRRRGGKMPSLLITSQPQASLYRSGWQYKKAPEVGSTRGTFDVLFLLHVDVVEGDARCKVEPRRITGRGVIDMKSQVAAVLYAMRRLERIDMYNIGVLITTDEESGGKDGAEWALTNPRGPKLGAKVAVVPDAGYGGFKIVTHEKGLMQVRMNAYTSGGHASRPWEARNAVEVLNKAIQTLREIDDPRPTSEGPSKLFSDEEKWHNTMVVTVVNAGDTTSPNRVPSTALAYLDIRYTEVWHADELLQILQQYVAPLKVNLTMVASGAAMATPPSSPYLREAAQIIQDVSDVVPDFKKGHGASDGRFCTERNIDVVMFKPTGGGEHSDKEWVDRESLRLYGMIMDKLIRKWGLPKT